jgi:GPI mannosyltransferase 3
VSTAVKPLDAVRRVDVSGRLGRARQYVRPEHIALAGVFCLGLVLRVWYARGNYGIVFPDEFHQSTEQAHRLVYGYGLIPWEFDTGARTWVWPVLLAGPLELGKLLGLSDPGQYTDVIRGSLVFASACVVPAIYLLARVFGARRALAVGGAALAAFSAPFVYFSHRAFSETASLLPVTLGFALAVGAVDRWRDHPRARQLLWAGALLLGFSVHLRIQNALFCIGLLVVLAWRRESRATYDALLAFGVSLLALAVTDLATWGDPLSSPREYVEYQLFHGAASSWGTFGFEEYATKLLYLAPGVIGILVVGAALCRLSRARSLFVVTFGSLVFYSLIGYWELRYALPILPFVCALLAVELSARTSRFKPRVGVACAAVLAALAFVSGLRTPDMPVYYSEVNSLMMVAGRQPDLCGLFVEPADLAWTGGYYLFHRDVPLYGGEDNAPGSPRYYNFAIEDTAAGEPTLTKTRDSCEPDPNFTYTLDEPP